MLSQSTLVGDTGIQISREIGWRAGMEQQEEEPMSQDAGGTEVVVTDKAAKPIGPYSQAIKAGGFVFVAGEKGIDPRTNQMVPGGTAAETRQTLENIKVILEAAGSTFDLAVASTVYLVDIADFGAMNAVYAEYFRVNPPGRTTVISTRAPAGSRGPPRRYWAR
jgi:2-iminobutanoate/2-iminopropanoate deaminase